ncbi:MAG: hypothetical protein AAF846_14195 [Chloroflexota bacterium]
MNKGRSRFRNLVIDWYYDQSYGLTVKTLRCGVCGLPVQSMAVEIDGTRFLTCSDKHLVGTEIDPDEAQVMRETASEIRIVTVSEYNNLVYDIVNAFKNDFDFSQASETTL